MWGVVVCYLFWYNLSLDPGHILPTVSSADFTAGPP